MGMMFCLVYMLPIYVDNWMILCCKATEHNMKLGLVMLSDIVYICVTPPVHFNSATYVKPCHWFGATTNSARQTLKRGNSK